MSKIKVICKTQNEYVLHPLRFKDHKIAVPLITKINAISGIPTDEQLKALIKALEMALGGKVSTKEIIDNIDYELAKKAIREFLGGVLFMDIEKVNSGKIVVDRNGKEHKVYSMMLDKETIQKVRELLPKIDLIAPVNNILDTNNNGEYTNEAYDALMELIGLALADEKLTNEEIEEFIDLDFAKNVVRIYLNLPVAA